jgi:hypothetical protein
LSSKKGYSAIRNALVAQKSKHIGSSMLELNVCGAIPPYNEILGGKLAALLALSPQILCDYKKRYGQRESEIATRLKNEAVVRPAELVYIGTTSLYYVGSSQYNRLKLPSDISASGCDVKWAELGKTVGFGTLHISRSATAALTEAANTRLRHVLGEGANPKLRLVKSSIRKLLEISANDADEITKHAMSRIVYGACIARNAREYLLGCEAVPEYWFGELTKQTAVNKTDAIIRYWVDRWLNSRVKYNPVFERLRTFDVSTLRLSEQLKVHALY